MLRFRVVSFTGISRLNGEQRLDVQQFQTMFPGIGILDYVALWYIKASLFIQTTRVRVAYVSTNSITQGEQVGTLWNPLFSKLGIKITFAHRTFNWKNEAKGNAAVHVVIIGFAAYEIKPKFIFNYDQASGESFITEVKNISPYLVEGPDFGIENRSRPLCDVAPLRTGNKPIDGGHYIFTKDEMTEFIGREPESSSYFKPFIGSEEFINGNPRYILWLRDIGPSELKNLPLIKDRVEKVVKFRKASSSAPTIKLASSPLNFHTECYPSNSFLIIPQVSSERRNYIPIGFEQPGIVCSDKLRILVDANIYQFGILTSKMHMAWMRTITGRLKSDYQYSVLTVYNNFPWPMSPSSRQIEVIEKHAETVLTVRKKYKDSTLADLYDPILMPSDLLKAHQDLDKAVDLTYRTQPFTSEAKRMEFLFELYEKYTADLFTKEKIKKSKKEMIVDK